jgi:tetratricopeptide (TPR) repeat protein
MLIRSYHRSPDFTKFIAGLSLLAVVVFSFFSYPFKYPFTWVVALLNMAVICNLQDIHKHPPDSPVPEKGTFYGNILRILVPLLSVVLAVYSVLLTRAEIGWNRIAHLSLAGKTGEVLPEYDKLYRYLGKNGLFLYNHAAELHEVKEYEKSLSVFEQCVRYYNDMDVQMLLADNYKELGKYPEAERHLKTAAAMCPSKFMPLYELVKLYDAAGSHEDALSIARQIIDKKIKIPSVTVTAIKNEMQQLLEKEENRDSATQGGTSDESKNHETRQGETPEVSPHGSALPP